MKIFISYRRADSTYLIGRIKDRLITAFGDQSVFRDLDDIPAGVDFRSVLEKETNGCNVMLVMIGPQWAGITDAKGNKRLFDPGDYTRIEVETGLKRLNETLVVPILLMNAAMPSAQDIPESLDQLRYQNAISIRNDPDFNHDIERLIRDIRASRGYAVEDISTAYFEPKTVYIAEGQFWMGSPEGEGSPAYEQPRHEVDLAAFRIGKYPLTNGQYEEFITQTQTSVLPIMGWEGQRVPERLRDHPVTGVTWYEARKYCEWLSQATGREYSLPNEAQWEKACRGGNNCIYPWGDEFDPTRCNYGKPRLAPVDAYSAQNEYECFDFVGNVRQWTMTLWGEKPTVPDFKYPWRNDGRNNPNANSQIRRVVRGSSFTEDKEYLRCSARSGQFPENAGLLGIRHGFRVAMKITN
jgi:formylglycine-generating enzyme required for sulfatase activity